MRKICVVISARPSYSRIKSVLSLIKRDPNLHLDIVLVGSALLERYGLVERQILKDGFEVSSKVECVLEGDSKSLMAKTTGIATLELASVFEALKPDIVVVIADRYETIATSIAASFSGITLAHVQGGEITGSIDERVRHANTKLADYHFPANSLAKDRLVAMGEDPKSIFVCGCPSIDLAASVNYGNSLGFVPEELFLGVGPKLNTEKKYCIAMLHPDTNSVRSAGEQARVLLDTLSSFSNELQTYWFWPNIDAGSDLVSSTIRKYRAKNPNMPFHFFKNIPPEKFLELLYHSAFIIGNSSVGVREASFIGVPSIDIGGRQSGRQKWKNVIEVEFENESIVSAIREHLAKRGRFESFLGYGTGNSAVEMVRHLKNMPLSTEKQFFQAEAVKP